MLSYNFSFADKYFRQDFNISRSFIYSYSLRYKMLVSGATRYRYMFKFLLLSTNTCSVLQAFLMWGVGWHFGENVQIAQIRLLSWGIYETQCSPQVAFHFVYICIDMCSNTHLIKPTNFDIYKNKVQVWAIIFKLLAIWNKCWLVGQMYSIWWFCAVSRLWFPTVKAMFAENDIRCLCSIKLCSLKYDC